LQGFFEFDGEFRGKVGGSVPLLRGTASSLVCALARGENVPARGERTSLKVTIHQSHVPLTRAGPAPRSPRPRKIVYDFDTGEQLYKVALPEGAATFDIEPDGTLVIADPACEATVSTISNPTPVPLGVPACKVRRVTGGRALLVVLHDDDHQTLDWTSVQNPVLHPVKDLGKHGVLEGVPAEMNETEVVYARAGCWTATVYRTSDAARAAALPARLQSTPFTTGSSVAGSGITRLRPVAKSCTTRQP